MTDETNDAQAYGAAAGASSDGRHVRQYEGSASEITEGFLNALFDFYVSGYYLDLNEGSFYTIGQEATYNDLTGDAGSWALFDIYIRDSIHPDDQALITEVSRIPYIRERLAREKNYSIEVRDLATGSERWYRYTTMRCADPDHAAISFMDVTDQVLARQERERLLQELEENQARLEEATAEQEAQIEEVSALNDELTTQRANLEKSLDAVSSLSKLYYASYYVDVDSDEYYGLLASDEISSSYGEAKAKGKSQPTLNWMCDNRIDPEYREAARAFVDYSTLSERMKDTEEVSILVKLVTGDWTRIRFIAGSRHEDGTLRSCTFVTRNVNDEVEAEMEHRRELEERVEEISALNGELEERQAQLEEVTAEQEAQIEEISALNAEVEASKDSIAEAYGMVEGFSNEYHTIWVVSKETSRMRLVRSNGKTTIQGAVQMGIDEPEFDPAVVMYANAYIEPEDRERFIRDASFAEVLRQLDEHPDETYRVNYLRRTDDGVVGYHQIAFANADSRNGQRRFVYGFRDIDQMMKEELERRRELEERMEEISALNGELEERQAQLEEATAEQEAQIEEISTLNGELEERQAQLEEISAEQEAQIEEISALNTELEASKDSVSEAYGMIEGLSSSYHTIWIVSKETSEMRLVRSSGKSTIQGAVQMGVDMPKFDEGFDAYIETYVEPQDRERMHREIAFAEVLRQLEENPDKTYAVNYLRRTDDGKVGYHQIAFANADTKEGHRRFVYGFRDIDETMKAEKAMRDDLARARDAADAANIAKTTFLFNMSHDIRTPMNAIVGFTELLRKHQGDPERCAGYLDKIDGASKSLINIINNVLDLARIESGTTAVEEVPWTVGQACNSVGAMFEGLMNEKGLRFSQETRVEHKFVYADPVKLNQVYSNLVSNAYKYTEPGGEVRMVTEEIPSDREGYVVFRTTVSDTGIGMDADYLPHLFEEFSREANTTESKVEGTGLGMPIVKRLVDLMDGTIEVESEKGVGTTFTVTFAHRIAEGIEKDASVQEVNPEVFENKRILLAEDNDLNAEIAMEILGEVGFEIERAQDGAVCVKMLEDADEGYYDAILMDIQMPNMNGYEATHAIRGMEDAAKAGIPILAMTANAFEEDRRMSREAGMNGHIAKPINVPELMRALAGVLG